MRHALCLALATGTLLAALVPVEAACPAIPIGVTVTTVNRDRQFLATDRAEALADTPESKELATAEARQLPEDDQGGDRRCADGRMPCRSASAIVERV